ncbi:MAG: Holliday junction ATP-dependent DNA helicase RuvB [Candidatus Curtissbacteria bacterium GW2011_GWA1_40_47]|uniref:Holliday junction branch migration complex subunit RuvB n=1 Tax=Candidatus Nomurabacteria bacterium GW2011_GWC2_42_20 TaxID=1618756 RepID=A0A0G0ZE59_9BACT|nr:MAG: Holliday junction ATP-dependent DNA helicase RuvB [Candidatus Curtissbacteria bacterium GW2011_GWA1_40_47]KKS46964.1 MAG: Holliday junction ATP-dependent DNA helicase RuvB [Candidatus Nomurabacteria bacterium GW2011_GWC2_42_20]KKS58673.1 MAG: Holliday junction ATP-dependent DNA helicase RuvB [Candidatus Nomurabacteria bacterium GW2011_GWA2_42_41]KKT08921.1 MAG: Holliday junction ATP-dependent DNA helicase RuvB [Candidatus Nomurabacteria bacterium GW2011_GWB1_43_20]HBH71238.1 Holliday ju
MSSTPTNNPESSENPQDFSFLDQALRPSRFDEYIGQETIKQNLEILLQAAKERSHPPEHVLFYGPPGLGKTTLAHLIANEMGCQVKSTSGPAIEKVGDLASILTNLSPGDVLFIDEIHRLNKMIEEVLYPAMESGVLDIIIGKGPSARTIQLDLPPFTMIAATTRVALISSPLRSRFSGGTFRLEFYTEDEIEKIIKRSAKILGITLSDDAAREIAKRSRATPRTANYLLKRARDFAQVHKGDLSSKYVADALALLEIDELGLTALDRKILEVIIEKFKGGPVGLSTIAAALSEEMATLEEVNEPYLLQLGLIERTPRGRLATPRAYEHLGFDTPEGANQRLL